MIQVVVVRDRLLFFKITTFMHTRSLTRYLLLFLNVWHTTTPHELHPLYGPYG